MTRLESIQAKVAASDFELSRHAVDQSLRRHISVQEIREAISNGQIIEDYPNDKYGPTCLLTGHTFNLRPLHVQCSYPSRPLIKIITVYEPDPALWVDGTTRSIKMETHDFEEDFVSQSVTYILENEGQLFVIENVPARVSEQTGEQLFSPETVERLQQIIWTEQKPVRVLETPVYEFAA